MSMMKRKAADGDDDALPASNGGENTRASAAAIIDVSGCDLSSGAIDDDDSLLRFFQRHLHLDPDGDGNGSPGRPSLASVENLDVSRCRLGPHGVSNLLSFLSGRSSSSSLVKLSKLRKLTLQRNAIGSIGGRAVGKFLALDNTLAHLEEIDMSLNDIKAGGGEPTAASTIADGLEGNSTLKVLIMDKCALGPEGAAHLAHALAANTTLTTLELAGNMIGPVGGTHLFRALKSNSSLERLGLKMNRIGGGGSGGGTGTEKADVRALSEALSGDSLCRRLAVLDLSYNDLRCSGCAILGEALASGECPLRELVLEKNDIAKDGAEALAKALAVNTDTMQKLVLRGNKLGDGGAIALGNMLKRNKSLQILDLSSCSIDNRGGAALGHGLSRNSGLECLNLDKNALGSNSDTSIFSVGISTNNSLKQLHISGNGLGATNHDGDAKLLWDKAIAEALSKNISLRRVNLSNNALSDSSIVDAVATPSSFVEYLDFSDNHLENVSIETQLALSNRFATSSLTLDLSLNPLSSPPLGRLANHATLQNYLTLLANEKTAVTRIRLMVLGFGGVGKSTFCRAVTNETEAEQFQSTLVPVQKWGSDRLIDWAERLGTPWSKDAARLIADEGIMGNDLSTLIDDGNNDGNSFGPSQVLLQLCSSKYQSIDACAFAKAISALIAKGYLSTVGAVKVEGTIELEGRTCSLVDFAGQVEFLVSHQLLLSSMHTLCMIIQPAPSFGRKDHRHFGSWDYWSKFLSSLGDRRRGSLLLAVSQLDKLVDEGYAADENQVGGHVEREFAHIKLRSSGATSCESPIRLDYSRDNIMRTISSIKTELSKSLDEVAHSWWVPQSYEALADILSCVAKRKSSNHELPILTKAEMIEEINVYCTNNQNFSLLLARMSTDSQLLQRAINYLEAVGDVMQAGNELLIDPIGWFSAFLAHFIKDDLAVSTIQVDSTSLRRQRGTVNLEDIVNALKHEYKSPQQHISQIMTLLCGLELCVPLKTDASSTSLISNMVYLFPCLLPPLASHSELVSCWSIGSKKISNDYAIRGHRFRETSGFIPPGLFVGILSRMYQRLQLGIMHPRRMWKDSAILVLNNKKTNVILRCDLENAIIDVVACAQENEQLFVGSAKGQASIVIWLVHLIKIFLQSYSQLNFEESWLCPNPICHGMDGGCNVPSDYIGSEFMLSSPKACRNTPHDCNIEGCWRFLGTGHNLEQMRLRSDCFDSCQSCSKEPVFILREKII